MDGKTISTIAYGTRTYCSATSPAGKDVNGPRSVDLSVQSDTPFHEIKRIVEACAAAGLNPPATLDLVSLNAVQRSGVGRAGAADGRGS